MRRRTSSRSNPLVLVGFVLFFDWPLDNEQSIEGIGEEAGIRKNYTTLIVVAVERRGNTRCFRTLVCCAALAVRYWITLLSPETRSLARRGGVRRTEEGSVSAQKKQQEQRRQVTGIFEHTRSSVPWVCIRLITTASHIMVSVCRDLRLTTRCGGEPTEPEVTTG